MEKILFVDFEFYSINKEKHQKNIILEISAFINGEKGITNIFRGYHNPGINDNCLKTFLTMDKYNPESRYESEFELYNDFLKIAKNYDEIYVFGDNDNRSLQNFYQRSSIEIHNQLNLKDFQNILEKNIENRWGTPIKLLAYSNILNIKGLENCSKSEKDAYLLINVYNKKEEIINDININDKLWVERMRPTLSFDINEYDPNDLIVPKINKDFKFVKIIFNNNIPNYLIPEKNKIYIYHNNETLEIEFDKVNLYDYIDNSVFVTNSWKKIRKIINNAKKIEDHVFYKISDNEIENMQSIWNNKDKIYSFFNEEKQGFEKY
ncbi:MAG: hypothetical protein ACRC4M_00185 [Mycoplasma sp.]